MIIKDFLFMEFFGSEITGNTLFMRDNVWTDEFETSFENANVLLAKIKADVSHFCPLSFGFENQNITHIVATTFVPPKVNLSKISN